MNIKLMTWNTQLYEYGNIVSKTKPVKPVDDNKCNEILSVIKKFIDESENAIAVLQEIPLRSNITNSEHIIFTLLCGAFPEKDYTILYNINEKVRNQIKTTVVISKKNFIKKDMEGINSSNDDYCNCFVSFIAEDLKLLAVHQSLRSGGSINDKINDKFGRIPTYSPDIILGDFNAGDYEKQNKDEKFEENRNKYKALVEGKVLVGVPYVDACKGEITTTYNTPIDHILIKNETKYQYENVNIDRSNDSSDHYPVYCDVIFTKQ